MKDSLTEIDEMIQMIKRLDAKAQSLLQDKLDGEDISFDREDIKVAWEEVYDEYKESLKQLSGADKEEFKTEYGEMLTGIKKKISKL
jgi:uncharacterized protein YabN with tetrapyrrole methylase and pyrophosphatase domain